MADANSVKKAYEQMKNANTQGTNQLINQTNQLTIPYNIHILSNIIISVYILEVRY